MATRGVGKMQPSSALSISFEQIEKTSNTLKRHPKMELSKPDLLQLLGVLEGELQAREIVIAVLKAEQVKQLLYPNKKKSSGDPFGALQRDSFGAFDATFDEANVKNLYNMQLAQLENFIKQQKNAQSKLKEQLTEAEERCEKILAELEDEKHKHAQDTAQGDDVTYLLEKERERLRQENEFERQQSRCMEKDIKCLTETLEQERVRQKQIVLLLLAERKRLILRYVEERQKSERLSQILFDEKGRMADMVDGLEEESKKSLQMEAEMERQLCEFEMERDQFKIDMDTLESKNMELQQEIKKVHEEMETVKKQASAAVAQAQLGEGVRSAIVAMAATSAIRSAPTVSPTISPPRGVAHAVPTKIGVGPATPAKPPGLQTAAKVATGPMTKPLAVTKALSIGGISPSVVQPAVSSMRAVAPVPEKATAPLHPVEAQPTAQETVATDSNIPASDKALSQKLAAAGAKAPPPTKMPLASLSTVTAAKKVVPVGRGAPPPIPPNKPVLTPQALHRKDSLSKPPVPPRSELATDLMDPKKPAGLASRYGVLQAKSVSLDERLTSQSSLEKDETQVGITLEIEPTATTTNTDESPHVENEVLGQELADFQQLLVSMASTKISTNSC